MSVVKRRNYKRYLGSTKEKAQALREDGSTHREIVKKLGISIGSAHLWTKSIIITKEQKRAIEERRNKHSLTPEQKAFALQRLKEYRDRTRQSDESLLDKIKDFYRQHQRIPLKRELNALRIYRERFGSWNNAICLAGFSPNPVIFSKKFFARDGHLCDSFAEKIIDDWLFDHGMPHERNWKYPMTKMTGDFFISPDTILEYFGLAGVQKTYDAIIERKREIIQKQNLTLIEVYPRHLVPLKRLDQFLSEKLSISLFAKEF